jgi:hypothetical protein
LRIAISLRRSSQVSDTKETNPNTQIITQTSEISVNNFSKIFSDLRKTSYSSSAFEK